MSNTIPNTKGYLTEMYVKMASQRAMLAGTFDQRGHVMAQEKGNSFSAEVLEVGTATTLPVDGTITFHDMDSDEVVLTLTGSHDIYQISEAEAMNTAHNIFDSVRLNAVQTMDRFVEGAIGTLLNTSVNAYVGGQSTALVDWELLNDAAATLDTNQVPEMFRTYALAAKPYRGIFGGPEDNFDKRIITQNQLPAGLTNNVPAIYAAKSYTNPAFGAGAFTVKTTAAAGLSTFVITGLAVSLTPALIAGTIIDIAHSLGVTESYVITAAANSDGSGDATVVIGRPLVYQATATDVITMATGATGTTFTKSYLYHKDFAIEGSRSPAPNTPEHQSVRVPQGWMLMAKMSPLQNTVGRWAMGAATQYGIVEQNQTYAVCIISA